MDQLKSFGIALLIFPACVLDVMSLILLVVRTISDQLIKILLWLSGSYTFIVMLEWRGPGGFWKRHRDYIRGLKELKESLTKIY